MTTAHRDACQTKLPSCALCQEERYAAAYKLLLAGREAAGRMIPTSPTVNIWWDWAGEVARFMKANQVIDPPDPNRDIALSEKRFADIVEVFDAGRKKLLSKPLPGQVNNQARFRAWAEKAQEFVNEGRAYIEAQKPAEPSAQ